MEGWNDRLYRLLSATEPNQARLTSLPGPIPRQPPHCHRPRTWTDLASGWCCLMEGMDGNIPIANIMMGHVPHVCSSLARFETIIVRRVARSHPCWPALPLWPPMSSNCSAPLLSLFAYATLGRGADNQNGNLRWFLPLGVNPPPPPPS